MESIIRLVEISPNFCRLKSGTFYERGETNRFFVVPNNRLSQTLTHIHLGCLLVKNLYFFNFAGLMTKLILDFKIYLKFEPNRSRLNGPWSLKVDTFF